MRGRVAGWPEPSTLPQEVNEETGGKIVALRIIMGPRDDWFTLHSRAALTRQLWTVTPESNRIGIRLAAGPTATPGSAVPGVPLERLRAGELPSEGVVTGSLQVPPSGLPVLFLADRPVTGGYPVIGVVIPEDLPAAAQLPPGSRVRFVGTDPEMVHPGTNHSPP
jgi:allophanate hydrolase subunit 2